jgi:hypothetical protein
MVSGRVTTAAGEPVAVPVDAGHTAAPVPLPAPVHPLRTRCGITARVGGGDRGMVQATGQHARPTAGFRAITALTPPPVRRRRQTAGRCAAGGTPPRHAGVHGAGRLRRRRRAPRQPHAARRRAAPWTTRQRLMTARHACVETATRAQPDTGRRTRQAGVTRHTREALVPIALPDGRLRAPRDPAAQAAATGRAGGDVVETAVPQTARAAQAVQDRARDRQAVEPACRTMTTGLLAVRPLGVRHAPRTRAPVVVTRVAWHVVRERRRALGAACGTTADDTLAVTVAAAVRA